LFIRQAQITTRNCIRWNRTLATALRCFASWKLTEGRLGVQVVEGVGLVASGFQLFTLLTAKFCGESRHYYFK
jgi:hypothetical protein